MSRYKTKRNKPSIDLSGASVSCFPVSNGADTSFIASQEVEDFAARLYYLGQRLGRPSKDIMNGAFDE